MDNSYTGKYLRINLTTGKVEKLPVPKDYIENYLGGSGFGTKLLWDEVPPKVDAFSPDNLLIFATGPLTGTMWPSAGRLQVIGKSPLTGIYGDASSGGFLAPELKYAGYDMVVFVGKAKKPVYVFIENNEVFIRDASKLWGKTTYDTEELIRTELKDPDIKVAAIGQAGENLVRFACITVTYGRTASRAGLGALMGSKKLKALAVRGTGAVKAASPEKFYKASLKAYDLISKNEFTPGETKYGTPALVKLMSEVGRFPTKNYQMGHFDYVDEIDAEALEKKHVTKHLACFSCPLGCDKRYDVKEGEFKGAVSTSLEYETLCSLGSKVWNKDSSSIVWMDYYCNAVGMDTISAGGAISFAMECFEKGILSKKDVNGLDLTWGNYHSVIQLLKDIANRKGIGGLLAEGVRRAAAKIGRGSDYYAMHVKGQEIPSQDGRSQQSMGLAHVTSSRGADHLKGFPTIDETGYAGEAIKRYGKKYLPEIIDGIQTKYKALVVKDGEDFCAICDSAVVCKFGTMFPPALYWPEIADGIKYASTPDMTVDHLKKTGERIANLQRSYNILHGISRKDDTLPKRFLVEKSPSKRAKGHVVYLKPMLDEYYRLRDWSPQNGYPTKEKLHSLGLDDAAKKIGVRS